jgi:hypothetical protein
VLKVQLGEAILLVDGKLRAVLLPNDYNGPRELLRKNRRFSAISELYEHEKVLYARIYAIEEALA